MKIVLATPIFPPEAGGPATYTVELAKRLPRTHEVVVVAYGDNTEATQDIKHIAVSKRQLLPLRLARYFFTLLREAKQADVIYVQNAVAAGLPAVLVGSWFKKSVILKFVGDEAWERASQAGKTNKQLEEFLKVPEGGLRTKIFIAVQKYTLRRASIVTTPSQYLSELLIKYYGVKRERVVVNYNAAETHHEAHVARKPYQIMTAVRLTKWKGVDGAIKAVSILKNKFPGVRLVVAGDGPEKEHLQRLAQELKVGGNVTFAGRLSKSEVLKLQSESAVQVLNSRYEGLPHGVLESYATKTPIVATDIPGTNEAVVNGETGLLVSAGDEQAFASAIERVFTDHALCGRIVAGGVKTLQEKFSWETHLNQLENMFKKALR